MHNDTTRRVFMRAYQAVNVDRNKRHLVAQMSHGITRGVCGQIESGADSQECRGLSGLVW